jgi:DNA-3-methyladenine glycosylase I
VPCHDERRLFEMLNLEGAQAGLSWETILNKRENYRAAFDQWDARKIAAYGPDKVAELLANPGIVRNRLKVAAAITNAQAYLRLVESGSSLDQLLWSYVGGKPMVRGKEARPAKTELSDRISRTCPSWVSSLSARRLFMLTCRASAWWTTMRRIASAGRRASDDAGGARHGLQ